ncbi:TetR/AcrR family transcriptional regulator [Streptomyces sp. KM273126]|uniref:TetR/AcrR family transcriptional regulator n=1 Tax=Streptomyces sp. KM273126 TaxID=2545247 RepID=UPI0037DA09AC
MGPPSSASGDHRARPVTACVPGCWARLEEIARRAGVGSATLHRHFPSRRSLLEVVFHDRVEALCSRSREHANRSSPDALVCRKGGAPDSEPGNGQGNGLRSAGLDPTRRQYV